MTKKIIALFLLFACLLPCLLLPLSAAEAELVLRDFSKSSVDTDLIGSNYKNKLGLEQKIENVEDIAELFPVKDGADASILEIMEVGYSTSQKEKSPITLYVWIYIPDPDFNPKSASNKITLADAFTKNPLGETAQPKAEKWTADSYNQYTLSHIGTSTSGTVHKFTVSGFDASGCISAGQRKYNVSRFDLHYKGKSTADNYKEGRSYIFTGSGKDLECTADGLRVLEIDNLHQTTFLYDNYEDGDIKSGIDRQTAISTVYFSIPAKYEAKYDELFSIKCDYDRYRSTPMITTVDEALYKELSQWILKRLNTDVSKEKPKFSLYGLAYGYYNAGLGMDNYYYDISYNHYADDLSSDAYGNRWDLNEWSKAAISTIDPLFWLFGYRYSKDGPWDANLSDAYVPYQAVLQLYESYVKAGYSTEFIDLALNGLIRANRSGEYGHHTEIITREKNFDDVLQGYEYSSAFDKWLDAIYKQLKETEGIEGINAIQKLYSWTLADIEKSALDENYSLKEYFAKNYLINESDYSDFISFARQETALGNTVVVFHFASSVYEKRAVAVYDGSNNLYLDKAYMSTQDIFLNFTIIEMTFGDKSERTIIPVSAPNINITGGTDPGAGKGVSDLINESDLLQQILGILMLILTIVGLALIIWGASVLLKPIFAVGEGIGRSADNARLRRELKKDRQNPPPGSTINVYIDGKKVKTKTDKPKKKPKGRKGKKR